MAVILKGAPVAAALCEGLVRRSDALRAKGTVPTLVILRVGERPDDLAYERGAVKRCESVGVAVRKVVLSPDCTREELLNAVRTINADPSVHGCLLLRPLPRKEDEQAACALLSPEKDMDGITAGSLAGVFTGSDAGFPPCTAQACLELLDYYGYDLTGKRVAVLGRSLVIGKPVSMLLLGRNATVTICHTKTADPAAVCRQADILIAAAGKAELVDETYVNPAQVLIDVGINVDAEGNLRGDVNFDAVQPHAAAVTPVPGGVGSVTTAVLAAHVIEAAERSFV